MTSDQPLPPGSPIPDSSGEDLPAWGSAPAYPPAGHGRDVAQSPDAASVSGAADGRPDQVGQHAGPQFDQARHPQGATSPPGTRFFVWVRGLGIVRPDPGQGRMAAGVAAGIAHRYQISPVAARIVFVLTGVIGGLGILAYGLGWMFLPHPDGRIHAQQVLNGKVTAGFFGSLLTILVLTHDALPLLLIALIIWMAVSSYRTGKARTP